MPRGVRGFAAPEPKEAETLRTGPMVRRGANVTRAAQVGPSPTRPAASPRIFGKQSPPADFPVPAPPLIESSCLHVECKLPINLRKFLAEQMGEETATDDDSILDLAAHADEVTLSKLARAIRRYSTARARESWSQCSMPLARFGSADHQAQAAALCLRCASVEFGADAIGAHQGPACVAISLSLQDFAKADKADGAKAVKISDRIQRSIEEFRALRIAFGLPHFDLDCYVRGDQMTFTWRPLP